MTKLRASLLWIILLSLVGSIPAAADSKKDNPNDIGNRKVAGFSLISRQKEMAIGKQYAEQIDHSARLIKDSVVTEYVNRVEQNIARNSDAKFPVTVKVIDDPTINAITLPGGFMYIDSGTILAADDEAELAGVLAHETGHVAERSWASRMTKREIFQYAMLPLMFTPMSIATYYVVNGVMSTGVPIAFLKFSRNQEEGADFLGIQYMWKAGYDPQALVEMFGKTLEEERQDPGSVSQIFMDHPPTPDRIIKCEEEIKNLLPKKSEYLVNTSEFDDVKARLIADLRVPRDRHNGNQPTLERRQARGNPPPPGSQSPKNGPDTGDQPPVLGHPQQPGQ